MTLTPPVADLATCFDLFRASAFRLETLRTYSVPAEAESLRAFRAGLPPERSVRTSPWLARIAQTTAEGKSWRRIRIVGWPLTEYERFQMACYPGSAEAGEDIRVAGRSAHPELAVLGDFWLFDAETPSPFAALMSYDHHGAYLGSGVTSSPEVIERCRAHQRLAQRHSIPLESFLVQQPA
jgi:hypothetical protein